MKMGQHSTLDIGASQHDEKSPSSRFDKSCILVSEHQFIDNQNDFVVSDKRPSVRDSIGIARLLILVIGSVALIAATTLLALLWQGAAIAVDLGDPSRTWRSVVDRGWAPVTVTICAAAIRTAMSLQAGVAMSMIASVLLERRHVKLGDSVFLSMIRAVSIQPLGLLFSGGRGVLTSLGVLGLPLLIVTGLIAIASTFTSSILLGDFGTITMLGDSNTSVIGYTNDSIGTGLMDVWRSPPAQFARFAEYTDDTGRITGQQHIEDTGLTFRAPLPMVAKAQRETLREYVGPATVFDHRVICVAPKNLTISKFNDTAPIGVLFSFGGHMTFDTDMPSSIMWPDSGRGEQRVNFECITPDYSSTQGLLSNITICMDPDQDQMPFRVPEDDPLGRTDTSFIIFNATARNREGGWSGFTWNYFTNHTASGSGVVGFAVPQSDVDMTREGPWTTTTINGIEDLEGGVSFSASACIVGSGGYPFKVTLKAESDAQEPVLGWTGTPRVNGSKPEAEPNYTWAQAKYDTSDVLRQLNIPGSGLSGNLTRQERGVMELDFLATNWSNILGDANKDIYSDMFLYFQSGNFPKACTEPEGCFTASTKVSTETGAPEGTFGHPAHVALLHDALAASGGSPARALQSWITTLTWQLYYDARARFIEGAEARYVHSVRVFAPRQWAGFWGVMAMLGCHVLVVAGVTAWYLRVTRYTMLGNSWQAVSQVISEETLPLIRRASGLKDSEVKGIIRRERRKADRYMIAKSRKTRRSELVAMDWERKTVADRKGS